MRRVALLAALVLATVAQPAAAARSTPHALAALTKVERLQQGKGVHTGFEMSPALHALTAALPSLHGDDRTQAEAILARPDDTQPDPPDTHKWPPGSEDKPQSPVCSAHFCVHWTAVGPDASNKTYALQMLDILENQVYPCENGTAPNGCSSGPGLGWRDPASDFGAGGSDAVDVYIEDLYSTEHVYGYTAVDPGQDRNPAVPHWAYMVMDNNYSRFGDGSAASGLAAEQVTAAHEYNHVLQNAYDYLEDGWMFESTAVYMEEKVYPSNNDYLHYVGAWVGETKQPLTAFPKDDLKPYGSAVWNHWLDYRFGAAAVRAAWEQSVNASDFAPGAYGVAIGAAGGGDFPTEFDRFSAAVAEWENPSEGFPDSYPDLARDGTLPVGTQTTPFGLPHTTFSFFDVPIPAATTPRIRVTGTLPAGTQGAVALVARTGADPSAGDVTTKLTSMPNGGTAAAELDNPSQYGRITAVVVNSDPSTNGFDQNADDYVFTKDASGVVLSMAEPGPPIPTTGGAGLISDHAAFVSASVDPHMIDTSWQIEYGRNIGYGSMTKPRKLPASTVGAPQVNAGLSNLKAHTLYHYRVLAINSAGVTAGRDMTFRTVRDVTKPKVILKVKRQRLAGVQAHGLKYLARCSEPCRGTAELKLGRVVVGKTSLRLRALRAPKSLHVRLFARGRKVLALTRRPIRLTLLLKVADDSHNRSTAQRKVTVVP